MNNWFDYILYHTRIRRETPAIVLIDRILTYAMLREAITSCAQRLAGMNFDRDGVVAVIVNNPLRHLVLCLALYRLGIVSLSLAHQQSGLRDIKVTAILGDANAQGLFDPANRFIALGDSWFSEDVSITASLPEGFQNATQICRHSLTSGSTGKPKIIAQTSKDVGDRIPCLFELNWNVALCLPGLSSSFGFTTACAVLAAGRTLCFTSSAYDAIRMIEVFSVDFVMASTEQLLTLTRVARKQGAQLRTLRALCVGGSVPSRVLLESAMIYLCKNILCRYGASETGVMAQVLAAEVISNPGLVGHVVPGVEMGVFDHQGNPCPAGSVGLVRCRIHPGGFADGAGEPPWIDLGDVGRLDPDGRLFIFGRASGAAGSSNLPRLSPSDEIEHLIRLEWDLADAASIIVEGAVAGSPELWIALVRGNDITAEKVDALLLAHKLQYPVRLFHLAEIPRGSSGKIDRPRLKAAMLASVIPKAPWN